MPFVAIEISHFVDPHQPGFVACVLLDAVGSQHVFIEKIPIVTEINLWSDSRYPQPGAIPCEIETTWRTEDGRALARIATDRPIHIESSTGQTRFIVLQSQLQR